MKTGRLQFVRKEMLLGEYNLKQAKSIGERLKGLLFSEKLANEDALQIAPCNSVHTFFMGYTIDVVYFDKRDQVCHMVRNLVPWRVSMYLSASYVIELAAGEVDRIGIQVGDVCKCNEYSL